MGKTPLCECFYTLSGGQTHEDGQPAIFKITEPKPVRVTREC